MSMYERHGNKNIEIRYKDGKEIITEEVLLERGVIIDKKNDFSVFVSSDADFYIGKGSAYFKWIDSQSYDSYENMARIRFEAPEYIYHNKKAASQRYHLKTNQIKDMMKLLQSSISQQKLLQKIKNVELRNSIKTNWEYLIYSHNQLAGANEDQILVNIKTGILINDQMIPMNTPMPNYLLLR